MVLPTMAAALTNHGDIFENQNTASNSPQKGSRILSTWHVNKMVMSVTPNSTWCNVNFIFPIGLYLEDVKGDIRPIFC